VKIIKLLDKARIALLTSALSKQLAKNVLGMVLFSLLAS
jgi:hypothetical protein